MSRPGARATPELLAAVDLGSNSFHLVIARRLDAQLLVIDRIRETVRLGTGLARDGRLDRQACDRALRCLERFGRRLRDMKPDRVRAVGTHALRHAKQDLLFLSQAESTLGVPIDIVSGEEEARLIYAGVSYSTEDIAARQLVVDIGGGSTELIIGEQYTPLNLKSTELGCVTLSEKFFSDDRLSLSRLEQARRAARNELMSLQHEFQALGWQRVIGSSGAVRAAADAIRDLDSSATAITRDGLDSLLGLAERSQHISEMVLPSLDAERRKIFAGGLVILAEVFDILRVKEMLVSEGAMRDGILRSLAEAD